MDFLIRIVLLLALLTASNCSSLTEKSCDDPLVCYLSSLQFELPSFCTTLPNDKELCVEDFVCKGVELSSIPSAYKSPTTLSMGAHGMGTSCSARTKYGRLPGQLSATIKDTSIDTDLYIHKSGEYANKLLLRHCNVSSIVVELEFSDPILNNFADTITSIIEKAVYRGTCLKLEQLVMTNVTHFVTDTLNPALAEVITSQPSPFPEYSNRFMDWNASVVSKLHSMVNKVHGLSNLPDFVRCMVSADNGMALIQAINSAVQLLPWQITLPDHLSIYNSEDLDVTLSGLSFSGLDTLGILEILEPIAESKVALRSAVAFDQLDVNVSVRVKIEKTIDGQIAVFDEIVQLSVQLQHVTLFVDLVVALDDYYLQSMYLDQLANPGCWVQPLVEFSVANLDLWVNPATVSIKGVSGNSGALEGDISGLINNALLLLLNPEGFNQLVGETIHGVVQGPLRQKINNDLSNSLLKLRTEQPCLSHYPYNDEVNLVDWQYSKIISVLNGLLNQYLGPAGINQAVLCATQNTGTLSMETKFLNIAVSGLDSFYAFSLLAPVLNGDYLLASDLGLGFCDSSLCKPLTLTISGSRAMLDRISSTISASLARTMSTYKVSFAMDNVFMSLVSMLKWDFNAIRDLQQQQLSYTGCLPSTLQNASMENATIAMSNAKLVITSSDKAPALVNRDVTKGVNALMSFLTQPKHLEVHNENMANTLSSATATCANKGVKPQVEVQDNGDVSVHNKELFMGELSWQWELVVLCVGSTACLAGLILAYSYWGSSRSNTSHQKQGSFTNNAAGRSEWRILRCLDYGASLLDYESNSDVDSDTVSISSQATYDNVWSRRWHQWQCQDTLLFHRRIPPLIRFAVPIVILGNIFLFIQSNLAEDAVSVMVSVTTGTTVHDVGSIFDFGLGSTVHDMWGAGVYPLAILIAFFSGAWPYVKLVVMLASWIVPPGWLTKERRESMLVVLDMLGKWSLVDFFVMVLMLCAFYFELVVYPEVMLVTVTVKPAWGFYSFLLATMISLGLGHTILACHRLVTEPKLPAYDGSIEPVESLCTASYHLTVVDWDEQEKMELLQRVAEEEIAQLNPPMAPFDREADRNNLSFSNPVPDCDTNDVNAQLGIGAAALTGSEPGTGSSLLRRRKNNTATTINSASPALVKFDNHHTHHHNKKSKYFSEALSVKEIKITRSGSAVIFAILAVSIFCMLAGVYLKTMGFHFEGLTGYMLKSAERVDYSYISIGTALPAHSGVPNSFAIRWLQASYFLFGVAMPLCFLASLLVLWFVPLSLRRQRQFHVLSEVFNAWSTLDVFCISIVAALLEIQQFAAFIVGDSCDGINEVLMKPTLDKKLQGDDKCFDVQAYVKSASWVLFLAAGLLIVLGIPSLAAAHHTIKRRLGDVHHHNLELNHHEQALVKNHGFASTNNQGNSKGNNEAGAAVSEEGELQRPLLGDEEARDVNHVSTDAAAATDVDSNLSRPLLESFSQSALFPFNTVAVMNNSPLSNTNPLSSNMVDVHRDANTELTVYYRFKSEQWLQRERNAVQALNRHREQHKLVRYLRQCCTMQAVYLSALNLLQKLSLLTITDCTPSSPQERRLSAAESVVSSPQRLDTQLSPAMQYTDIYNSSLSPLPFPFKTSAQGDAIDAVQAPLLANENHTNSHEEAESLVMSAPSPLTC
jgi:hypothetical protein